MSVNKTTSITGPATFALNAAVSRTFRIGERLSFDWRIDVCLLWMVSVVRVVVQDQAQPTFRTSTRLVVSTVSVTGRDGRPIEGLTAGDFVVTENSEPQEIAFLEYQRLDDMVPLPAISVAVDPNGARPSFAEPAPIRPNSRSPTSTARRPHQHGRARRPADSGERRDLQCQDIGQSERRSPLIENGQKLLPSATRVFSASREMHFYLEGYEQYAATAQPLVAFATFYRDGSKVFESQPVIATQQLDRTSKAVPIRFSMPLSDVPPGRYDCQVTVIDPAGAKAAFWQTPIAIVP